MRRCLILDDADLEGTIDGFKKRLANGDDVTYVSRDISLEHNLPSFTKTANDVIEDLRSGGYDLFACDMQLGFEDDRYGYDIIQKILKSNIRVSFILYSGDFAKLADILSSRIKKNDDPPQDVLNAIKYIDFFADRSEHLDDHVIRILNEKISAYEIIKRNLEKYPCIKIDVCHSGFQGKTCGEIAKALDDPKHNAHVNRFAEDLIERAINHMMDINK